MEDRSRIGSRVNELIGESLVQKIKRVSFKEDGGSETTSDADAELQSLLTLVNETVLKCNGNSPKAAGVKRIDNEAGEEQVVKALKVELQKAVDSAVDRSLLSGVDVEEISQILQDFSVAVSKASEKSSKVDEKTMLRALKMIVENARRNSSLPDLSISTAEVNKLKAKLVKVVERVTGPKLPKRSLSLPRSPTPPKPAVRSDSALEKANVGPNEQESKKIGELIRQLEVKFSKMATKSGDHKTLHHDVRNDSEEDVEYKALRGAELKHKVSSDGSDEQGYMARLGVGANNALMAEIKSAAGRPARMSMNERDGGDCGIDNYENEARTRFEALKSAMSGIDPDCVNTLAILYSLSQDKSDKANNAKVGARDFGKLEMLRLELEKNLATVTKALRL